MILLTGATGFIGRALVDYLSQKSISLVAAVRRSEDRLPEDVKKVCVGDLSTKTDFREALRGVETVVHLAARVHVMNETLEDPLAAYRQTNVEGTLNLARQAAMAGVQRFVFVSSIKVNGESTAPGLPFSPESHPEPLDPYGVSKWEAEQELFKMASQFPKGIVILRLPLVYGPGVKANFFKLMTVVAKGWPLPFGAIRNRRSMIGQRNLVDLIWTCIEHPRAKNQTFLATDGPALSTTKLLQSLAVAFKKRSFLIPIPQSWMEFALKRLGKEDFAMRLCGNLEIDGRKNQDCLNWQAPYSFEDEIKNTVEWYQSL